MLDYFPIIYLDGLPRALVHDICMITSKKYIILEENIDTFQTNDICITTRIAVYAEFQRNSAEHILRRNLHQVPYSAQRTRLDGARQSLIMSSAFYRELSEYKQCLPSSGHKKLGEPHRETEHAVNRSVTLHKF